MNIFFKNISWLFFDNIVRTFGSLFIGIWTARYLGPNNFGILSYSLAFTGLFTIFVHLGLNQILVREIVKNKKLENYFLGTSFILKLCGAIVAILFIIFTLSTVEIDSITKFVIFLISFRFLFQSFDVIDYYFQSKILSKYVVIARNSAFVMSSLIKIYLILGKYTVDFFAILILVEAILSTIFLIIIYIKKSSSILKWKFSKKLAIRLLSYSWPLAISVFIISIYTKVDQIMIGNMLSLEEVGLYGASVRISTAWMFIPSIILSTFMPYFVKLRENDYRAYDNGLISLYSLMFWLSMIIGLFFVFFGKEVIVLLFGEAYKESYYALIFNIWGGIFMSQAIVRGIWLVSENLQKYRLYNNIFAVSLNILANFLLIPIYGISGAALATLLTQGLSTWFFPFIWKPIRKSNIAIIKSINPIYLFKFKGVLNGKKSFDFY